ncbi:ABC transporter permease [Ruegeria sp. EL01]|jgi:ribose/xylose/arabinose/galactoside ABC-type transport system permease subunit|uniref:ABC transporter permease n=1 Tax=Ruegeria sp. EL01 TaxID=2107578 RepID=UPI000EA7FE17|nr:ABC transporter permease [Ruegeria sp. EL01]
MSDHESDMRSSASPVLQFASRLAKKDDAGIAVALIVFLLIGATTNQYFMTSDNLFGILQNITFLGFLAIGVGLVLMAGEIDISIGSIFGLSAVCTALALRSEYGLVEAVCIGLMVGVVCGFLNAVFALAIQVPFVVITLATLGIYRALALVLADGRPVSGIKDNELFFDTFGQGGFGQLSYITLLFIIIAVVVELVLKKTSSGFRLLAVGSNPLAAKLVGYDVNRTRMMVLTFSGFLAGASGVCSVAYLRTAGPTAGTGYELSVLAAVIIGGVSLTGGRGSILGVMMGLAVIGVIQNLIVLWGISPNWTQAVSGIVLIAAMALAWFTRGGKGTTQ